MHLFLVVMPLLLLLLVTMHLILVVMPGATISDALVTSSFLLLQENSCFLFNVFCSGVA